MKFADLHLHTRYSDGSFTPDELVRQAARHDLSTIAVTDHDTLDAVREALAAGLEHGVEVIPGVEITCRVETTEIHMLGYFLGDTWQNPSLGAVLEHSRQVREKRMTEIVGRLNSLGIALTVADVQACSEQGTFGRPHVAQALQKRGVVASNDEAFERFLKRGRPAFVERYRMTAAEAIGLIKRAGGAAVLAHPGLNKVDGQIHNLIDQGLAGLEVWHTRQSASQSEHYLRLVEQYDLLATGGSDCHGTWRGPALIGGVKVPYENVVALKERISLAR